MTLVAFLDLVLNKAQFEHILSIWNGLGKLWVYLIPFPSFHPHRLKFYELNQNTHLVTNQLYTKSQLMASEIKNNSLFIN